MLAIWSRPHMHGTLAVAAAAGSRFGVCVVGLRR
jgi:hypothetical protein